MSATAILSALAEEQQGLIERLTHPVRVERAGREFWRGELQGQPVVLGLSRLGKVAAATTATALIEAFGVSRVVFTGVAGGLATAAAIGAFGTPIQYSVAPVLLAFGCAFGTGLVFGYLAARHVAARAPQVPA